MTNQSLGMQERYNVRLEKDNTFSYLKNDLSLS